MIVGQLDTNSVSAVKIKCCPGHGVSIIIFATFYFQERDEFMVIEGMVREVKMDSDGFVCVFLQCPKKASHF